jgi:hypothetical protein
MNPQTTALDWLPAELAPVALRLSRADELEYQLGWECQNWSLHALEMKQVRWPDGLLDVGVAAVRLMPPVVLMLFSEVINHLRAAIDNVMLYVVESRHGAPLPADAASHVAMPIHQSAAGLQAWVNKRKRKIPEFDTGTDLYELIEKLQPVKSLAVATAIPAELGELMGNADLHGAHPEGGDSLYDKVRPHCHGALLQHMRRRGALMRGAPSWSRLWVSGRCRRSG